MKLLPLVFSLFFTSALLAQEVRVSTLPATPLIEKGRGGQLLNFDFVLENTTKEKLDIREIEASVFDEGGRLVSQKRVGANGMSVLVIPNRYIEPGGKLIVFNPLYSFDNSTALSRLRFDFTFDSGAEEEKYRAQVEVRPRNGAGKTLLMPVNGRILIHDGHDFYSHHRRLDVSGPMTTALGVTSNPFRYSYDFCVVDEQGKMYRGDGEKNEDWFGFGVPLYAPAAGKVVVASDGMPDNTRSKKSVQITPDMFMKNPLIFAGNYVVIDHQDGTFSFLAHLKNGSVRAKKGDVVKAGQQVGEMGFSGDAFLVHLHYQLQSDAAWGEGIPSYFRNFDLLTGGKPLHVNAGQIDSGDVVVVKR
jgi:hypothetical protein